MRTGTKVLIGSAIVVGLIGSAVGVGIAGGANADGSATPSAGNAPNQATAATLPQTGGGSEAGVEGTGDGHETQLVGSALDRATAAALAHTGGGEVIETETGDEGAAYGVEIRKSDGSVVEVQLDASFQVTGVEADDDGAGDGGSA